MPLLCYHSVHPTWDTPIAVRPSTFAQHCAWLARHTTVRPVLELLDAEEHGRSTRRMSGLTFDDGFADFAESAMRPLLAHRLPATVFIVAGTLDQGGGGAVWLSPQPATPPATLTQEQVLDLVDRGVSVGSHSWSHRDLRELSEEECLTDLRMSRERLEDVLKRPVPLLAYPYGFHAPHVRRAALRAGYTYALSLPQGKEPNERYAVPRIGVYRHDGVTALRAKMSRWYLPLRMNPVYAALRPGSVIPRRTTGSSPAPPLDPPRGAVTSR